MGPNVTMAKLLKPAAKINQESYGLLPKQQEFVNMQAARHQVSRASVVRAAVDLLMETVKAEDSQPA